jgi:conjugative transposon TraN protein
MKNRNLWFAPFMALISMAVFGQRGSSQVEFKNLQIAQMKTTSVVFPYPIKSIDKGSSQVLIQKAKGVENILLVKAGKENFSQTNLTVVTTEGNLYGFILNYDEQCPDLNFLVQSASALNGDIVFTLDNENQKKIQQYAQLALMKKRKLSGISKSKFDISLRLTGVYIHQDVIYLRLLLGNKSKINFDIDQLRFFIGDQRKSTRTASQEIEMSPLLLTSELIKIPERSELSLVCALPKFTIGERKYLTVELLEKNGQRQLGLDIKDHQLMDLEILGAL